MTATRKTVTLMVVATFEGDYYDANQCSGMLSTWITDACEDRDDLRGVAVVGHHVTETPIDGALELSESVDELREALRLQDVRIKEQLESQKRTARRIWAWIDDGHSPDVEDLAGILDRLGLERPTPRALGDPS